MKKLCLLSGMILGVVSINADIIIPGGLKEKQLQRIEDVQLGKFEKQRELARPAIYKMIDPLVDDRDWPAIFHMLDKMQGVIDVNEYYDNSAFGLSLLYIAVIDENIVAVERLLEKYKANPNLRQGNRMYALLFAVKYSNDLAMVKLLLKHGANPYIKDPWGEDSFANAKGKPEMLRLLYEATSPARAA